jgi:glycosyltransferase involved in cell wall biosynthesis
VVESSGGRHKSNQWKNMGERPLFSIGLATYNRKDALKRCLESILAQTYGDFEVIVGNDYPMEPLSPEVLEINDSRIRIVNHPQNLGEFGNLKSLLQAATGKYFTWQFDDDLYARNFLDAAHAALVKFGYPSCVFTSYKILRDARVPIDLKPHADKSYPLSGREFLRRYLSGRLTTMGLTGVYDLDYLRRIGGVEHLSNSAFALYSEYLLLFRTGLLQKVAFVDAPLVFYSVHEGSWGASNSEVETYRFTSRNLVRKSVELFSDPALRDDFNENFRSVLRFVIHEFVAKASMRQGLSSFTDALSLLGSLRPTLDQLEGRDLQYARFPSVRQAVWWSILPFLLSKFKAIAPRRWVNVAFKIHMKFRKDRFFRFK